MGQALYEGTLTPHIETSVHIRQDAHDERDAQHTLSEAQKRVLVEMMPNAIFTCNSDGLITYYNQRAAELWGRSPKLHDPADRYCGSVKLFRPDGSLLPHNQCPMALAVLTGRSAHNEELHMQRPDGTSIITLVNVDALFDANGHPNGAINVFEDISGRKESEEALRQLNTTLEERVQARTLELERSIRELDQFAYVTSHDLKAPLRGIRQLADWIYEDAHDILPDASKEHLLKLQGRVKRMELLLNDLLAYSRAGRQRHAPEPVNIAALVGEVTDMLALPPGFVVEVTDHLPTLNAERAPLESLLRNLIGNAVKHHHNPDAGRVEIHAQKHKDMVEFVIRDNGPGIDPRFHTRIFEMFQTLQPRDQVEGSGLGLALVKKLVESRGGSISVQSQVGEGATFRFTWPTTIDTPL